MANELEEVYPRISTKSRNVEYRWSLELDSGGSFLEKNAKEGEWPVLCLQSSTSKDYCRVTYLGSGALRWWYRLSKTE